MSIEPRFPVSEIAFVPVIFPDGSRRSLTLVDALEQAHLVRSLDPLIHPREHSGMLRLLPALVSQMPSVGPRAKRLDPDEVRKVVSDLGYLDDPRAGATPFLQAPTDMEATGEPRPVQFMLNPDHPPVNGVGIGGRLQRSEWPLERCALSLVALWFHMPGKSSIAMGHPSKDETGAVSTFSIGPTLLHTILANLPVSWLEHGERPYWQDLQPSSVRELHGLWHSTVADPMPRIEWSVDAPEPVMVHTVNVDRHELALRIPGIASPRKVNPWGDQKFPIGFRMGDYARPPIRTLKRGEHKIPWRPVYGSEEEVLSLGPGSPTDITAALPLRRFLGRADDERPLGSTLLVRETRFVLPTPTVASEADSLMLWSTALFVTTGSNGGIDETRWSVVPRRLLPVLESEHSDHLRLILDRSAPGVIESTVDDVLRKYLTDDANYRKRVKPLIANPLAQEFLRGAAACVARESEAMAVDPRHEPDLKACAQEILGGVSATATLYIVQQALRHSGFQVLAPVIADEVRSRWVGATSRAIARYLKARAAEPAPAAA